MDEYQGITDAIIAVQENVNVEGAVPKLSPEELAIYNILSDAKKVTFLKVLGQRKEEGKKEGRKEGKEEGKKEGKKEGKEEGKKEGKKEERKRG
ncbi:5502_t:CDS:2, partial [Acaulospora morrowiae]